MQAALLVSGVLSGVLMGAAGAPHCLAMCGASSAAVLGRCGPRAAPAFHLGRFAGYMAAGAVAAASVSLLRRLGETVALLHPFWTMLHVAALGLGLWLLATGRQPAWMAFDTRVLPSELRRAGWQRVVGPARASAAGAAWVAWPCGLLQSALIVAALADTALGGALVMGGFALASSAGLLAAGWVWRLGGRGVLEGTWMVRVSGLCLALASGWALGAGLWHRAAAWCLSP